MQEQLLHAAEPGRRPAQQQYAGVDLRRPKGYAAAAPPSPPAKATVASVATEGEPCPRCESRDTKFCYYNNYNTSQPRHFCKGCRRYWTKGGTLRSVPVGGGTRKRPASSSSSPSAAKKPSKKRRAATPPEPSDVVTASPAADAPAGAKTTETTTTPPTEASATASEITTELVVPAAAADEDSFTDLLQHGGDDGVALDLGFSDYPAGGGKALQLGDAYSFEWPPAFDLGAACWGGAGFADPDPGVFMNLP